MDDMDYMDDMDDMDKMDGVCPYRPYRPYRPSFFAVTALLAAGLIILAALIAAAPTA